ncbi:MAG: gliding motility lipoprotein GldH [Clostridia bacterium]|nr:gliding motility lipoprotein GldH [Clostridia bacterium]
MSRNSTIAILLTIIIAVALTACNRKTEYHHYEHTPITGWEKNDTLVFDVGPIKKSGTFREEVGLRINGMYPFMSLCLVIEQTTTPGALLKRDTLNCSLIDSRGNVKGQGISNYQYNFHLNDLTLNRGDSLRICIRHNMKREILPGIADVGLLLKEY